MDIKNIDIELDGVESEDYPDFCNAFIARAHCMACGRELTEKECQQLQEDYPEAVFEEAYESLID